MEADEAGCEAGVAGGELVDVFPDDGFGGWARAFVEAHGEWG